MRCYSDPSRETEPHALPDVEVFHHPDYYDLNAECKDPNDWHDHGWYYAYGQPGCLWDSDPMGPYDTAQEAQEAALGDD